MPNQKKKYKNEGKNLKIRLYAPSVWTQQKSIIELVHDELKLNYGFPHSANRLFGIYLCLLHSLWPRNYYCCCSVHQINVNNKKEMFIVLYCYFTINFLCCFSSSWSRTLYTHTERDQLQTSAHSRRLNGSQIRSISTWMDFAVFLLLLVFLASFLRF